MRTHNHPKPDNCPNRSDEDQLRILNRHLERMRNGEDPRSDLIDCVMYDIEQIEQKMKESNGKT